MIISASQSETEARGESLAQKLGPGEVIGLTGDVGAGKTHFTKGIARGLGVPGEITSPTFTLVHEYERGRLPLYHFDFYRLERLEELVAIGFEEYLDANGVCVIEWADRFREALPERTRWVHFEIAAGDERQIAFDSSR
ncbi:MAG: tRNA (adenosine(37)-N6)-threonylcarbamoyltransferase complex ATPase subunit type 1 TsaE [Verrucomicrobiota bacterium]